jgi:hypothetical protein
LRVDPDRFARDFDRLPFGYDHELSGLDLLSFDAIRALAERYDREYFVAGSAPTPGTPFYSVTQGRFAPGEALERLDTVPQRVLLKRPEMYDARYGALLRELFATIVALRGGLRGERVVRLASSILVSSAAAITPFHFDPEISFFFQIAGDKVYHLYTPSDLSEPELERFYTMGIVNIGQVDLAARDPRQEHVFALAAGKGMHQPQNCPHWVETRASRSISYVFSYETDAMRAAGRTRACNYYLRRMGGNPAPPGVRPDLDRWKAAAMRAFIPARKGVAGLLPAPVRERLRAVL